MGGILSQHVREHTANLSLNAVEELRRGLDPQMVVGEVLKLDYDNATLLIHDEKKQNVKGIPYGSFLIATRMPAPDSTNSNTNELASMGIQRAEDEDAALILLRVMGVSDLPNRMLTEEYRFQAGMRATGSNETWDASGHIDDWTRNSLHYGGYRCRVLGTLRMRKRADGGYALRFGGDLVNFYTGIGLKVFKPTGALLDTIVNYRNPASEGSNIAGIRVGRVRYAASEISPETAEDAVPVLVNPMDFLARRTFYGGMSRGGKSNAMKIAARAIYRLRASGGPRVGQIIFDPNGEYANENAQNASLRRVCEEAGLNQQDEVSIYGLVHRPDDLDRRIVKVNFFGGQVHSWGNSEDVIRALDQLQAGKSLIETHLSQANEKYIKAFRDSDLSVPEDLSSHGDQVRYRRLVTVYRCALVAAGMAPPESNVNIKGLFSQGLQRAMAETELDRAEPRAKITAAAKILGEEVVSWDRLREALEGLRAFIEDDGAGWNAFDQANTAKGRSWADANLRDTLQIFMRPNGVRSFASLRKDHSPKATEDYAKSMTEDLRNGKLVIFDQSVGEQEQNTAAAERIMTAIFNRQKQDFTEASLDDKGQIIPPPNIMVYLEEAHNLLPSAGNKDELKSIWARSAKEGSKYRIGMVLATQEPSSVMPAILKNTDNWFVAHLNNDDEIRTVTKFGDFEDYKHQIKAINEPGFVRMRTLSNPHTIPVQIDLFQIGGWFNGV